MTNITAINESVTIPNHETADTAWREIKAADAFVKKTMSEINAAEKWITIGVRLNELKATLIRTSQFDKSAPGWVSAFADGRFAMVSGTGSKLALIGEIFGEMFSDSENIKLPASWDALYQLASGFKSNPEKLKLAIREGKVTALMSIKEAKALAGKKPCKPKKKTTAKPPKVAPMRNFRTLDELRPQIVALLDKMSYRKRLHALNNLATYIVKQFPELEIKISQAMSSIKIGGN